MELIPVYGLQPPVQRPTHDGHMCGLLHACLGFHACFRVPELLAGHGALFLIAVVAGPAEVRDTVRSPASFRGQVLHFEMDAIPLRLPAVAALMAELFRKVLADLIAHERPLLVLYTGYLRVPHLLCVESGGLHGHPPYREYPAYVADKTHVGPDLRFYGRRQPALMLRPYTVVEPRLTVSGLTAPSPPPVLRSRCQVPLDVVPERDLAGVQFFTFRRRGDTDMP